MSATPPPMSLDERIVEALRFSPSALAGLRMRFPRVHPDALAGRLLALKHRNRVISSPTGIWSLAPPHGPRDDGAPESTPETPAPLRAPPEPPATEAQPMGEPARKACKKCGSTDFTESGKCRPCKAEANRAYAAKKKGAAPKPDPAPARNGALVIANGYTLRIPDDAGKLHEIPVTLGTIRNLHEQLEEFV